MTLRNLTLRSRVGWMTGVGVLLVVVTGVFTIWSFLDASKAGTEIQEKLQPAATTATQLLVSTADMERGVRGYVLTQRAVALTPFAEGVTESSLATGELSELLAGTDPLLQQNLARTTAARQVWLDSVARPVIADIRANRDVEAEQLLNSIDSQRKFELMRAEATALNAAIDSRSARELKILADRADKLWFSLLGSLLILLVAVFFANFFVKRWVLTPLDLLRRDLREVRRENNDHHIYSTGPPELRWAGEDAERMRERLVSQIEGFKVEFPVEAAIRTELTRAPRAFAPGLEIYGELQPAEGVLAGDWWDAITLPDGRTAIIVTDISGHGPEAGFAGLRLKLTMLTVLQTGGSAVEAVTRGTKVFEDTPARFATAALVIIDPHRMQLEWVNAGHLPPAVIPPSGIWQALSVTGPLLSTLGGSWRSETLPLAADELVAVWTDGISESRDAAGEQLEDDGVCALVTSSRGSDLTPEQVVPAVLTAARSRSVDWRRDDVTLVIARLAAEPDS